MKLAFLSVYVFGQHTERLLQVHWERIRQFTKVPYKILVAAPQATSEQVALLRSQSDVELLQAESPKSVRGNARFENSFHLTRLAEAAMDRPEFTHCMAVHPDSFPIRENWIDEFHVSADAHQLASLVPNGYSAGLFWNRLFYESYRPSMLVDESERNSAEFQRFRSANPNIDHVETGLGYIYAAWKNDVRWQQVRTTADRKIYGNGHWFHLVGASWLTTKHYRQDWFSRQFTRCVRLIRPWISEANYRRMLSPIELNGFTTRDGSPLSKRGELRKLIEDPDTYVAHYLGRYESQQAKKDSPSYDAAPPSAAMGS